MKQSRYPEGWDAERVRQVLEHIVLRVRQDPAIRRSCERDVADVSGAGIQVC